MREIVQIKEYSSGLCLISLRPKEFKRNDITVTGSGNLDRLMSKSEFKSSEDDMNVFKVIALPINNVTAFKGISLSGPNKVELKEAFKNGKIYLEIECNEDGYPNGSLTIYGMSSRFSRLNITPTEALERIKQFNEKYTNNHKLTPGLHESS
jgi:hypothetical protein